MKSRCLTFFLLPFSFLLFTSVLGLGWSPAWAGDLPENATFTTLITTPLVVEGLTGDDSGNLYTTGRNAGNGVSCPVWKINLANPSLVVVGNIPAPSATTQCSPSGIAFNDIKDLFVADGNNIFTFTPNSITPPTATVFASGVLGTNGLAFDRYGNLWTGDGTQGRGIVWKITPGGVVTEEFRIQPMRNGTDLGGDISVVPTANQPTQGVGRQARTFPHTAAGGNPQDLVANGLAFNKKGDLFIADTARGAIWKVEFDRYGNLKSETDCDATFAPGTLCLNNIFVTHPLLDGTDGIALDRKGNIWNSANERNAIVVVTEKKQVVEVFRNLVNTNTNLRNSATNPADNDRILETPTSPFLSGKTFCTANSDGNRRDNFPATSAVAGDNVGEIGGVGQDKGKISCMDDELKIKGLPLPVE